MSANGAVLPQATGPQYSVLHSTIVLLLGTCLFFLRIHNLFLAPAARPRSLESSPCPSAGGVLLFDSFSGPAHSVDVCDPHRGPTKSKLQPGNFGAIDKESTYY